MSVAVIQCLQNEESTSRRGESLTGSRLLSDMNSARRYKLIHSIFQATAPNNGMEPHNEAGTLLKTQAQMTETVR